MALSLYLGKRRGYGSERLAYKPHNTSYVVLGTVLLWFGWFGFNGGSALSSNLRAVQACIVTNLSASVGGLTWMLWVSNYNIRIFSLTDTSLRITALSASGLLLASALVPLLVSYVSPLDLVSSAHLPPLPLVLLVEPLAIGQLNSNSFSTMMIVSM